MLNHGHTVLLITNTNPGCSDKEVIEKALKENSIILTFDRDYGEIIFKYGIANPPAVVYFRFKGNNPEFAGKMLDEIINAKMYILENTFTVIEENNIRQRVYISK